jgi:hypothetical protein
MFLSDADLKDLTGYQRPAPIKRWLAKNGYRYEVAANGWPRVLKAAVEARLGFYAGKNPEPRINFA